MDVNKRVKSVCDEKRVSIRELAKRIGMSFSGLYTALNNDSLKVITLIKIAEALQVNVIVFLINPDPDKFSNKIDFLEDIWAVTLSRRYDKFTDQLSFLKDYYIHEVMQYIQSGFNIPDTHKKDNESEYLLTEDKLSQLAKISKDVQSLPFSKWNQDNQNKIIDSSLLKGFYFEIFAKNYMSVNVYLQDGMVTDNELISFWNEWQKE